MRLPEMIVTPPGEAATAHVLLPDARRVRPLRVPLWGMLMVMSLGLALAGYGLWAGYQDGTLMSGVVPHLIWTQGAIESTGMTAHGMPTVTVVTVTGRPVTVVCDFNTTTVFQPSAGVLNLTHLTPGQDVILVHRQGVAQSIEIVRQPPPWFKSTEAIPLIP